VFDLKEKKMQKISRRAFVKLSATAVAGTVLTACAPAATPAPVEEVKPTEAPKEEPTKAPEAPAEEPKPEAPARTWPLMDVPRNQTLIYYNNSSAAGNVNPFAAGYTHQNGNAILYEPCAYYSTHSDKTYMWLAESYKYNEDATVMDVTFKKGIVWSDGTPFTAADMAYMMNLMKEVPGLNRGGTYTAELDKAEAVDDLNLKVTLVQPDWRLFFKSLTYRYDLGDYSVIQPMHIWKDVPKDGIQAFKVYDKEKGWPVSTGPYGVGDSNDQLTNYDLRPTWWAVETGFVEKYPEVVRIQEQPFTNDTVAGQKLINNEIDHPLDLRPMVVASLLAQAGDHIDTWTGKKPPYGYTDWWPISVQMCTARPPTDDPKVRWAVSYAINRDQLVQIGWGGAGTVANSPFPAFKKLDEYMAGIKDLTDQYNVLEYNLEKSAALMTEAGYTKNAEGLWADKDGVVANFDIYAGVPLFGDLAPVIAQQLFNAGFSCTHKAPNDVWAAKVDGRATLFLFGHGGATVDPYDTMQLYRKANVAEMGQQSWGNITRWWNDTTEQIAEEVNKTAMDDPKMKDLFKAWMTEYYVNLPDAPIVQWYHRIPVNTTYWTNWPTEQNPYMNSALWHLTEAIVVYGLKSTGAA
jgi:peptide/nickel transport system substrate-binding protein